MPQEEKRKKLQEEGTPEAKAELEKLDRMKKLHVGNICTDKYNSKHEKSSASSSADPKVRPRPTLAAPRRPAPRQSPARRAQAKKDDKLKIGASNEAQFMDGYDEFLAKAQGTLDEYAAIDEEDDKSEEYILKHTELLSEHATGYYLLHCINLQAEGKTRQMRKTARQYLLLTYVVDLVKTMPGRDARDAIKPLFKKMAASNETMVRRDAAPRSPEISHHCRASAEGRDAHRSARCGGVTGGVQRAPGEVHLAREDACRGQEEGDAGGRREGRRGGERPPPLLARALAMPHAAPMMLAAIGR